LLQAGQRWWLPWAQSVISKLAKDGGVVMNSYQSSLGVKADV